MTGLLGRGLDVGIDGRCVLAGVDIEILPGQCWGILGANGAGKTTLLHTLAGLRAPLNGALTLDNRPLSDWPGRERARSLGLMPQDSQDEFPATVLETALAGRYPHLSYWRGETSQDVELAEAALARMDLAALAGRSVTTLSGGERRRLAFATLLVQQPRYWLLDEPTNHLDLHYQVRLLEEVGRHASAKVGAAVMVLHDVNQLVEYCSHALLLIDADTALSGRVADLIDSELLSRLYRHPISSYSSTGRRFYFPD